MSQDNIPSSNALPIKAVIDDRFRKIVFYTARPLLTPYSFSCRHADPICAQSPLATTIFNTVGGVFISIHNASLTLGLGRKNRFPFEETARTTGRLIRETITSNTPVVLTHFFEDLPDENTIRETLQSILENTLNPQIAGHGGIISLDRVEGNTVYIQMSGGCQGCAGSQITLRNGIDRLFREAIPHLGAIVDSTDHAAGKNPFLQSTSEDRAIPHT